MQRHNYKLVNQHRESYNNPEVIKNIIYDMHEAQRGHIIPPNKLEDTLEKRIWKTETCILGVGLFYNSKDEKPSSRIYLYDPREHPKDIFKHMTWNHLFSFIPGIYSLIQENDSIAEVIQTMINKNYKNMPELCDEREVVAKLRRSNINTAREISTPILTRKKSIQLLEEKTESQIEAIAKFVNLPYMKKLIKTC